MKKITSLFALTVLSVATIGAEMAVADQLLGSAGTGSKVGQGLEKVNETVSRVKQDQGEITARNCGAWYQPACSNTTAVTGVRG